MRALELSEKSCGSVGKATGRAFAPVDKADVQLVAVAATLPATGKHHTTSLQQQQQQHQQKSKRRLWKSLECEVR
jgi:hypothetical protein